MIWKR